jgi:hypothetical protein
MVWLVVHEFPQYTIEDIMEMSMEHIGFLLGGLVKYHTGKKSQVRRQFGR